MTNSPTDLNQFFRDQQWGTLNDETVSGSGSTLRYTAELRVELPKLLRKYRVRTFLDAPCGDFNWMKHIDLGDIAYIGMDIVESMIERNRQNYAAPNRTFLAGDITGARFPDADLMMCRDCLFHLRYVDIDRFLANFRSSSIPYLLLTSHMLYHNRDIETPGRWRQLNMRRPPFNFPEPLEMIEDWIEGHPKRFLGLWSREQLEGLRKR